MRAEESHVGDLLRRAVDTHDPDDALRAITALRSELDRLEREHVTCARVAGSSWTSIADALGITRQAVGQRLAAGQWDLERELRPTAARLLARAAGEEPA